MYLLFILIHKAQSYHNYAFEVGYKDLFIFNKLTRNEAIVKNYKILHKHISNEKGIKKISYLTFEFKILKNRKKML